MKPTRKFRMSNSELPMYLQEMNSMMHSHICSFNTSWLCLSYSSESDMLFMALKTQNIFSIFMLKSFLKSLKIETTEQIVSRFFPLKFYLLWLLMKLEISRRIIWHVSDQIGSATLDSLWSNGMFFWFCWNSPSAINTSFLMNQTIREIISANYWKRSEALLT